MVVPGTVGMCIYSVYVLTSDAAAAVLTLVFLFKVVAIGITATIGEPGAFPVYRVVVPAGETRPAWSSVRGL